MDWNEDGRKDLIVGEPYGKIYIFLNTGTNSNPAFSGSTYLKVGGSDFDCGYRATPEVVDWNNDGKKDVLCGDDDGYVSLLINTGTNASPAFSSRTFLQDGGSTLDAGTGGYVDRSCPVAVDWNADGKKDLLVGRTDGRVVYFENKGTDSNPSFSGSTLLQAGGSTLDAGIYSRLDVFDWNNDGQVDLLAGNDSGRIYLYLAIATGPATSFAGAQRLKVTTISRSESWRLFVYNYHTGKSTDDPTRVGPGTFNCALPTGQWIGAFLYSFTTGKWEEGLWGLKADW